MYIDQINIGMVVYLVTKCIFIIIHNISAISHQYYDAKVTWEYKKYLHIKRFLVIYRKKYW
jgi:hypothetical protein